MGYIEKWHIDCSRGVLDAIIDLGRDLEHLDNTNGIQTITDCVLNRIGTPFGDVCPPEYKKYMRKYSRDAEGRIKGYLHTLRFFCYADFGNGSIRGLIDISRDMRCCFGDDNTLPDGGMEALDDAVAELIGSPPPEDERYSVLSGYVNVLRAIGHIAHIKCM